VKRLDDDEDRQNPAYVPRKGSFFEHDLRQGSEDSETKPYVYCVLLLCHIRPHFFLIIAPTTTIIII